MLRISIYLVNIVDSRHLPHRHHLKETQKPLIMTVGVNMSMSHSNLNRNTNMEVARIFKVMVVLVVDHRRAGGSYLCEYEATTR